MAKKKVDVSENIEVIEDYQDVTAEPAAETVAEVEPEVETVELEPEAVVSEPETIAPEAEAIAPEVEAAEPEVETVELEPEAVVPETEAVESEPEAVTTPAPLTENVYVCYCSPQGLRVKAKGQDILLNGVKVSDLVTQQGGRARSGKFGVTCLPRETWNAIEALYSKSKLFKSGRIVAVNTLEDVKFVTVERNVLRHGREQVNPSQMGVTKFSEK